MYQRQKNKTQQNSGLRIISIPWPVLYGLRGKDIFYIFKWLENNQEKDNFITYKNYMKFKFPHLYSFIGMQPRPFILEHLGLHLCYSDKAEWFSQRQHDL